MLLTVVTYSAEIEKDDLRGSESSESDPIAARLYEIFQIFKL